MGATTRAVMRFSTRCEAAPRTRTDARRVDGQARSSSTSTRALSGAILGLYRSSPSDVLAASGARLATLTMPALVVWGEADPYIPVRFGRAFAQALPDAELVELADAGHWPW